LHSLARNKAYAAYGAEFLDTLQGLATLKAFGQSAARRRLLEDKGRALFQSTMWVLGSNVLARGIADTGIAVGAVAALALGVYRVQTGAIGLPSLLVILMLGVEVFRPLRELRVVLHQGMLGTSAAQGILAILRLLLRFSAPRGGRILVGGRDVRALRLEDLRAHIAIVQQDTYLFHGTVEDNLRIGKPAATADELAAAARAANAEEFIVRLPQGYQTVVGERGVRLSGGQRQRIAIARALLRDAPILILDEALSSVDAESEAVIQQALDRLMEGRTTLIFAHRLSSVIGADRILALDEGRVVESGTHAELMGRGGAYHRLMAAQAQDDAGPVELIARPELASEPDIADGEPAL